MSIEPFVLFSPDATTTLAYRRALAWLSERGFTPRGGRFVTIDRELLGRLYPHQARGAGLGWELVVRLFELDVSLVVALGDSSRSGDPALRLAALKGSSDPAVRGRDTLRALLGAESRIVNFVHTPDSAEAARDEARLLRRAPLAAPPWPARLLGREAPPVRFRQAGVSASRLVERLTGRWEPTEHPLLDPSVPFTASAELRRALGGVGVPEGSLEFEWAVLILACRYLDDAHGPPAGVTSDPRGSASSRPPLAAP